MKKNTKIGIILGIIVVVTLFILIQSNVLNLEKIKPFKVFAEDNIIYFNRGNPQNVNLNIFNEGVFFSEMKINIESVGSNAIHWECAIDPHDVFYCDYEGWCNPSPTCNGICKPGGGIYVEEACSILGYDGWGGGDECRNLCYSEIVYLIEWYKISVPGVDGLPKVIWEYTPGSVMKIETIDFHEEVNKYCEKAIEAEKEGITDGSEECYFPLKFSSSHSEDGSFVKISIIPSYAQIVESCSDEIMNQDETGIDCGGVCNSCDTDGDGFADDVDDCPNSPLNKEVNENGCALSEIDSDGDGFSDDVDGCPLQYSEFGNGCPSEIECNSDLDCSECFDCINKKCIAIPNCGGNIECKFRYWFDEDSAECEYKEFCGTFMYQGLRTFETLDECNEELKGDDGKKPTDKKILIIVGLIIIVILISMVQYIRKKL